MFERLAEKWKGLVPNVACGHADHADANAARNIRRRGLALLHGEEHPAKPTPLTRETNRRLAA